MTDNMKNAQVEKDNQKNMGFTLIEVLISFSIFLVICSLIPQFMKLISHEPKLLHHMEVSLFFQQLASDVDRAATVFVVNNTLYLNQANNEQVTYSMFQQRIRRQVNNKGQEIVLQNVSEVTFLKWKNGIDVIVKDLYQQTHERRLSHVLPLEAMHDG
ncbi:prepilin-type N-terminal cleavage/methylation domain-containing protein [Anaerobacillus sp. CMMVII]|uniref:competence type IV pilus minor pilin ComGF n=1 Tax=Anaerobacillus sp. CMMVII TaxID=2755588 RepID=UPI0021B7E764|nr:competence type IV pilus minor pilin ComGF [Anaerobacillus sp. CMMVII]MCT8138673.1 prepilin-type N-terminal cleavage/methylation domain-containing protein [Anaerobacillus sp. CMMVII]